MQITHPSSQINPAQANQVYNYSLINPDQANQASLSTKSILLRPIRLIRQTKEICKKSTSYCPLCPTALPYAPPGPDKTACNSPSTPPASAPAPAPASAPVYALSHALANTHMPDVALPAFFLTFFGLKVLPTTSIV